MKKLFSFLLMILILGTGIHLQAAKPIPSFHQNVSYLANFQEKPNGSDNFNSDLKGKRNMIIVAQVIGPAKTPVIIYVYSLDGRDILGPFEIDGDGQISVPIDDRLWGVIVQCDDKCQVSVYTSDGGGSTIGGPEYL
jgi:hypothetical protein